MKIYDAVNILRRELKEAESSVGGKFGFSERLRIGGIGSPMLYYLEGKGELDRLQAISSEEIRVNIELFKKGIFLRVSERTNPYFIPIPIGDIVSVNLFEVNAKTRLDLLLANGDHIKLWGHLGGFNEWDKFLRGNILSPKRVLSNA